MVSSDTSDSQQFGDKTKPLGNDDGDMDDDSDELPEVISSSDEDVEMLNFQLDQLNNALDDLEQKNDRIQARLMDLLRSNREMLLDRRNHT